MKLAELIARMDETFHPEYQENYDNSGFLLGDPERTVNGVLAALDLTEAVAEEAIEKGLNLIVTHHPVIFGGLKHITPETTTGRLVLRLVESGVAVYAAHTNLDNLKAGVNGILAAQLGLEDCHILRPVHFKTEQSRVFQQKNNSQHPTPNSQLSDEVGAGMIGTLPAPMSTAQFLAAVKEMLHLNTMRVGVGALDIRPTVQQVALCGGSGSFLIDDAVAAGADVFLTGDLKYHDFQKPERRLVLADIGHYESEQFSRGLLAGAVDALGDGSFKTFVTTACDRWEVWV